MEAYNILWSYKYGGLYFHYAFLNNFTKLDGIERGNLTKLCGKSD